MLSAAFDIRELVQAVLTSALNRWFDDALEANPPPAPKGKRIKLRYIIQAGTRLPRRYSNAARPPKSYERYLVNGIRSSLGFEAVPVRVALKSPKNPYSKTGFHALPVRRSHPDRPHRTHVQHRAGAVDRAALAAPAFLLAGIGAIRTS